MTFAATLITTPRRRIRGQLVELVYALSGVTGDSGGDVTTGLKEVVYAYAELWKSDYSVNIAVTTGRTATAGQVKVAYSNPAANHAGRLVVVGKRG